MKKVLITGSSGLIGSEAVSFFSELKWNVFGIDNNMRKYFFGDDGDTVGNLRRLKSLYDDFRHHDLDIRNRQKVIKTIDEIKPDLLLHCAAQPSHDLAAKLPFIDFEVNATGTLNLLEATRQKSPGTVFIFLSTNKVYGDAPNRVKLIELETRWDFKDSRYQNGISEDFAIDQSLHSLFGASKLAADIMAQEYAKYFNMKIGIYRGGCLTGTNHAGAEQHGFLSYLFKAALENRPYTIYGYKGKQVRDQIHSVDVVRAFYEFYQSPKSGGPVYNLGGGKENSVSVLEAIDKIEQLSGKKLNYSYSDMNRIGDHICYYSDLSKLRNDFPSWDITFRLDDIFEEFLKVDKRR